MIRKIKIFLSNIRLYFLVLNHFYLVKFRVNFYSLANNEKKIVPSVYSVDTNM